MSKQPVEFDRLMRAQGIAAPFLLPLMNYYFDGICPDLWLSGVLSSNVAVVAAGSPIQMQNLQAITTFLQDNVESQAWGSMPRFQSWTERGGAHGIEQQRLQSRVQGVTMSREQYERLPRPGVTAPTPEKQWKIYHVVLALGRSRPQHWPYPGPFWTVDRDLNLSGRTAREILSEYPECVIVRAILPEDVPVRRVWPNYRDILYDSYLLSMKEGVWYTTNFPCPDWWDKAENRAIGGTEPEEF